VVGREVHRIVEQPLAASLIKKLESVIARLDKDNLNAAIHILEAFIREINGLVQGGQLTPEDAAILFDAVQGVIDQLNG
jgi:hypothetical protein